MLLSGDWVRAVLRLAPRHRPKLPEESELRVVGHPLRRPRRIPGELDLDLLDAGHRAVASRMSSSIIGPAGQPIDVSLWVTLTFALDLDVVQQAELDDVHPELGILHLAERLDDVVLGRRITRPV